MIENKKYCFTFKKIVFVICEKNYTQQLFLLYLIRNIGNVLLSIRRVQLLCVIKHTVLLH